MEKRPYLWPTLIILSTLLVVISYHIDQSVAGALWLGWLLRTGPGLAVVGFLPMRRLFHQLLLGVFTSLLLNGLFFALWSPQVALPLLLCFALTGAILQLMRIQLPKQLGAVTEPSVNHRDCQGYEPHRLPAWTVAQPPSPVCATSQSVRLAWLPQTVHSGNNRLPIQWEYGNRTHRVYLN